MTEFDILETLLESRYKQRRDICILKELKNPYEFLQSLFIYLDIYIWLKNSEGIKKTLNIAEQFLKIHNRDSFMFKFFIKKAKVFDSEGDIAKSFGIYRKMLNFSYKIGNDSYISESLMKNGSFWELVGKVKKPPVSVVRALRKTHDNCSSKALQCFSLAESIYKTNGINYNYAVSIFNRAYIYFSTNAVDLAYETCLEAIGAGEHLNSEQILSNAFLLLANIYDLKKNFLMSKIYYEKAFECYKQIGGILKASDIMHKLAWILAYEKKYSDALRKYEAALSLKVSLDYKQALGEFFFQRAVIMKDLGDFKTASKLYNRALFVYNMLKDNNRAQFIKFNLFKIYKKSDQLYSFLEFMTNYRPPISKEILNATITSNYALRFKESSNIRPHCFPEKSFDINRKNLSNIFGEMSHICSINGNENKYKQYFLQFKAVKSAIGC